MAIEISNEAREELKDHAKKHDNAGTFYNDLLKFAEGIWHDVRTAGEHKGGVNNPNSASNPDDVKPAGDTAQEPPSATEGIQEGDPETNVVPSKQDTSAEPVSE